MDKSFEDILSGNNDTTDAPPADAAPAVDANQTAAATPTAEPAKAEPARGPDGKFVPKGETTDAPPASTEFDGKATIAERRKRQDAEARIAALEAQIQAQPPQPAPDMFDKPEEWQQHFGNQIMQNATRFAALNAKLETSEMLAAQAYPDFEDTYPKILEFMEANPAVRQEVLQSRHPWAKAYQMVKNNEQAKELGATDVESLRAKIREEILAEQAAQPAPAVHIPNSLATAQGGTTAAPTGTAPPTLRDILGR
jgi:hypothetical protein